MTSASESEADALFRKEALDEAREAERKAHSIEGDLIRISPAWTNSVFWLLLAVLLAGAFFVGLATIDQYAEGPAVVRIEDTAGGTPGARTVVIAMLPGYARPLLAPGMPLRVELIEYRGAPQELTIGSVGEVIGLEAARRDLGQDIGDANSATGSVVLVEARMRSDVFHADGHSYPYHDGMRATAGARVRKERVLFAMMPALRGLFGERR